MMRQKHRLTPAVSAGSMADIAFLLLIFFMVVTAIVNDRGILVRLPPLSDAPVPPVAQRNLINIKINGDGALLFEQQPLAVDQLRERIKTYLLNPEQRADLPSSPTRAVVSLQNDRATPYAAYLGVYDQIQAAYRELWEVAAQQRFQKSYEQLAVAERRSIKRALPQVISEAEPTDYR